MPLKCLTLEQTSAEQKETRRENVTRAGLQEVSSYKRMGVTQGLSPLLVNSLKIYSRPLLQ